MSLEQLGVQGIIEPEMRIYHRFKAETGDRTFAAGSAVTHPQSRFGNIVLQFRSQALWIRRRYQPAADAVGDQLRIASDGGCDYRKSAGHGFEESKPLLIRLEEGPIKHLEDTQQLATCYQRHGAVCLEPLLCKQGSSPELRKCA